VAARLRESGCRVELVRIQTSGDVTSQSLQAVGGQGLFTKEIQRALLDERVDFAVHSLKDLPTDAVEGLSLAAVPPRESSQDVLVSATANSLGELPNRARVGTGSRRRSSQLRHYRPDLDVQDVRGNLDTRLRKLDAGQYDAIVLAEAGLKRLGWADRIAQVIPREIMLPAVGQGALGIECRSDDDRARAQLQRLNHAASLQAVLAERAMLAALRAGCLAPVGAWGRCELDRLTLDGVVLSLDGRERLIASACGSPEQAESVGRQVAESLLAQGASQLIAAART
jgi:hydroxymethylbilane synthase